MKMARITTEKQTEKGTAYFQEEKILQHQLLLSGRTCLHLQSKWYSGERHPQWSAC